MNWILIVLHLHKLCTCLREKVICHRIISRLDICTTLLILNLKGYRRIHVEYITVELERSLLDVFIICILRLHIIKQEHVAVTICIITILWWDFGFKTNEYFSYVQAVQGSERHTRMIHSIKFKDISCSISGTRLVIAYGTISFKSSITASISALSKN